MNVGPETIAAALASAQPGDLVSLAGGTYVGALEVGADGSPHREQGELRRDLVGTCRGNAHANRPIVVLAVDRSRPAQTHAS